MRLMQAEVEKEKEDKDWEKEREEARRKDEEKTEKNRRRRQRKKGARGKNGATGKGGAVAERMDVDKGSMVKGPAVPSQDGDGAEGQTKQEEIGVIIHEED